MYYVFKIITSDFKRMVFMKILLGKIMKEKNVSYRKVEKLTGISKSSLHDITSDRISPRLNTLEIIAMALQTKISDLYDSPYK